MSDLLFVFCYDVSENRRRNRIANRLESRAVRVQRSIFEARMSKLDARKLAHRLANELGDGDSLKVYALNEAGVCASMAFGSSMLPEQSDFILV